MLDFSELAGCLAQLLDKGRALALAAKHPRVLEKPRPGGGIELYTHVDLGVESLLREGLAWFAPSIPVIAEETSPGCSHILDELCFVIDPIDGTSEFIAGGDGYSIAVALLERGRPVLSFLDFPARQERFYALRGHGAWLGGQFLEGMKLRVSARPSLSGATVAVSPNQSADPRFVDVRQALSGSSLCPRPALSAKLAAVASSHVDAALFMGWPGYRSPAWDFAAAGLVLTEAGGQLTSLKGTDLLDPVPPVNLHGWVAANSLCRLAILESLEVR
jgi:myo-inositol-1(or 4)-monophosphatase